MKDENVTYNRRDLELRAAAYYASIRKPEYEWTSIEDLAPQLAEFAHRVRARDYDGACRLTNLIDSNYLFLWGHYTRLVGMRQALVGKLTSTDLQMLNMGRLGYTYRKSWKLALAEKFIRRALQMSREIDDRSSECFWFGELGRVYRAQGDVVHAISLYENALKLACELGNRLREGFQLGHLGTAYLALGQLDQATKLYEEVLCISDEIGDEQMYGKRLGALGHIYYDKGQIDLAIEYYRQSLQIAHKIGDRRSEGSGLGYLGRALLAKGKLVEAQLCCEDALALEVSEINYRVILVLGIVFLHQQRYLAARNFFKKSSRSCRTMLDETARLYLFRYVLATALVGQSACNQMERQKGLHCELLIKGIAEYQKAIDTCAAPGVIQDFLHYLELIRAAGIEGLEPVFELLEGALHEQY